MRITSVTRDQQLHLLCAYQDKFSNWSIERSDSSLDTNPGMGRAIKHANWMIHEMLQRMEADEDKPGQVDRWIGFIQGIMWCHGFCSIDAMKAHNTAKGPPDDTA